jgi:anaerobic magnesium-protoporphyrin IX monomethyl ester cyclase
MRVYSNENILKAVQVARKYGIKIGIFNLVGIPGEM